MPFSSEKTKRKLGRPAEGKSSDKSYDSRSYLARVDLDRALNHLKADTGTDKSDMINEAISQYLAGRSAVTLPLIGHVQGGDPALAEEHAEEHLALPGELVKGAAFLLRVTGDSMEPAVMEGDLVAVRPQKDANTNDIVVALTGDEQGGVVKRYVKPSEFAYLSSDNPDYEDDIHKFELVGKVVALIRDYN